MKRFGLFAAMIIGLAACSKDEPVLDETIDNSVVTPESPQTEPTLRTIKISASSDDAGSRASLSGTRILWDSGDAFRLANEHVPTLKMTVNGTNQALGISVSNVSTAKIKYDYIRVAINGIDVTQDAICDDAKVESTDESPLLLGIPNSQDKSRYPRPGVAITTNVKNNWFTRGATLVLSSNSSNYSTSKVATVSIKGIQYSTNNGSSWTSVTQATSLVQGDKYYSNRKAVSSYSWLADTDAKMELSSEAGKVYGSFDGQIDVDATIDSKTKAVFPYSKLTDYQAGVMTISLPEEQAYVETGIDHEANIMVGDIEQDGEDSYKVQFKNMMGILKLSLTGDNFQISEIEVVDRGGNKLWGNAALPAGGFADGISTSIISGGSSSLTMSCSGVTLTPSAKDFYFVVPVGSFSNGLDVTVKAADGTKSTFGTSRANTIARNDIKAMPAMAVSRPVPDFDIENDATKEYLNKGPYSKWGARSYFHNGDLGLIMTDLAGKVVDQDYSKNYPVSWSGNSSSTYRVTLRDNTRKADIFTDRAVTGTSYEIINMTPGHSYAYTVKDEAGEVMTSGGVNATGRVRFVSIDDSWNYRDLGGWEGLDGRKIVYELIYRGGSLNGAWKNGTSQASYVDIGNINNYNMLSAKSQQQITDLRIAGELDLRAIPSEQSGETDTHAYSLNQPNTGIDGWIFKRIMTNNAQTNPTTYYAVVQDVAWIIDQVVNHNNPVAFHCKSGADRTGCVGFTILALLGVSEGNIALEYELTNFSHENKALTGSSKIRGKYTSQNTGGFYGNGFTKFTNQNGIALENWQERAYYYLNQHFASQGVAISSTDLDRFIEKMLGMSAGSYSHPSWATANGNSLESIYEKVQTTTVQ